MIACVSPSELNIDESINTLNYASFAKSIQMKPIRQNFENSENVDNLKNEIENLKNEIEKYKQNFFYNENLKLKSIIKNLRAKITSTSSHEKTGLVEFSNISFYDDVKTQEECGEINEIFEADNNLEQEYSKKVTECIVLKNDNEILKELVKALRERESNLMKKIYFLENNTIENESPLMGNLIKSTLEDKYQSSSNDFLNKGFDKNIDEENILKELHLPDSSEDDSYVKLNEKLGKKEEEIKNLKEILRQEKKSSKGKIKLESNLNLIGDRIKKLKDFQSNLKQKLCESEYYKTKIVKQKNAEIGIIKKEAIEKSKIVYKLEMQNWKNQETMENHLNTINFLKGELRTKSCEIINSKTNTRKEDSVSNKVINRLILRKTNLLTSTMINIL